MKRIQVKRSIDQADFNGTPRYILGAIDNESLSATLRVNYNINPNLTIQYYGQPFIFKAKFLLILKAIFMLKLIF